MDFPQERSTILRPVPNACQPSLRAACRYATILLGHLLRRALARGFAEYVRHAVPSSKGIR
eukprot:277099-Amphidinium_carterae.1